MKKLTYLITILSISLFATSCGGGSESQETEMNEANEMETPADEPMKEAMPTIVDLAVNTEFLSTLVAAVQAGDLAGTLSSEGPFTVFAPTNDAFAALPEGTLENLLKPENKDQLVAILTYHVVAGKVMSTDLSDGMTAATVNGAEITIGTTDGVTVNGANVTAADIEASNGVVHVIDAVILPPAN